MSELDISKQKQTFISNRVVVVLRQNKMEHLKIYEAIQTLSNIDNAVGLFDLQLEKQLKFLEFFKRFKDIERGKCRGRGFSNCFMLNHKRNPKIFTPLEAEFYRLAQECGLDLAHEVRIKVKDRLNQYHTFKLDFYDPRTKINIEVSPNWHKNYRVVERRDQLRKLLLKRVGIRMLTVPVVVKGKVLRINGAVAKRVIKTALQAKQSPNSLEFYLKGGD